MENKFQLFTDGGARGNPGPAGIGYILFSNSILQDLYAEYIGKSTNNIAEYKALELGLNRCLDLEVTHVECFLDSELVVKQISGEYKVKNENLKKIFNRILKIKKKIDIFEIKHIPREQNKFADKLANIALDAYQENR